MPLSEDEQRILSEIERQFYEHDPAFARQVGSTTVYSHARRNLKFSAVAFVAGLGIMLVSFASSVVLGAAGFIIMLAAAISFERNLRRLGKAGWQAVTSGRKLPGAGLKDTLGDARERMRDRFRRRNGEE